jgi:hypothetical protein
MPLACCFRPPRRKIFAALWSAKLRGEPRSFTECGDLALLFRVSVDYEKKKLPNALRITWMSRILDWGAHPPSGAGDLASRSRTFPEGRREDCFGGTPKPTRETSVLPETYPYPSVTQASLDVTFAKAAACLVDQASLACSGGASWKLTPPRQVRHGESVPRQTGSLNYSPRKAAGILPRAR